MKNIKTKQKIILKIIFVILAISILVLGYSSSSFATEEENVALPGFISFILMLLRGFIAVVLIVISFIIGLLVGGQAAAITVETFIFNQYELTSLNVFIGSKVDSTANELYGSVSKWFGILFGVALVLEILVLLYLAITSVLRTLKQDPKKEAEIKKMIKDYLLGLLVLFGMGIFIIAIILLNNVIVSALHRESAKGIWDQSITMELWADIFNTDVKIGTQSLILYIIISAMGLIFFVYYFKRLLKVSFLIIISPIVAVTYAINRRSGNAKSLLAWSKMFIYTVLIQVVHALTYVSFLSVVVEGTTYNSTTFIPSMILLVSGLKFLWDSETIIGSLFGIAADKVQGNTAFLMGLISQGGKLKQTATSLASNAPKLKIDKGTSDKKKLSLKAGETNKKDISKKDKKSTGSSKEDIKDKDKIKDKGKEKSKKPPKEKRELTAGEQKMRKVLDNLYEKRPLKGLGTAAKEYTITKAKSIGKQTLKRTGKTLLKTATKVTVAGITAVASHATPQVGMAESAMAGYRAADWGINSIETIRDKRKYKEGSKAYETTLTQEAEQLNAIRARKEKLGKEAPDSDNTPSTEEKISPQEQEEQNEAFKQEFGADIIEDEVLEISSTSRNEIQKSYTVSKKEAITEFQERTGKSEFEAKEHVEKLQKDILNERNFNYEVLSDVDKKLMHKYLNLITKDKIDDFETNTEGKIKYKEVIKRAKDIIISQK